ncbi:MAG: DUF4389 domain-containing protein [Chloroflexi bacterium]|nr:DUF4389 domain-containing protein [Chloroflexota bacterium]
MQSETSYPIQFTVDFPEAPLDRLSSFLRILWVIPIGFLLSQISGSQGFAAGGILTFGTLLMILFRQKYPRWWFDWNLALSRFSNRVFVYLLLLRDEYPSTDEEQAVHLEMPYPDVVNDLNRWLPLVKWFLAIPHYIILFFLWIGVFFAVIVAWFSIIFTGKYPEGLFGYVVGVMRWSNRVGGYAFVLVTDVYPPFRLGV